VWTAVHNQEIADVPSAQFALDAIVQDEMQYIEAQTFEVERIHDEQWSCPRVHGGLASSEELVVVRFQRHRVQVHVRNPVFPVGGD
jgi:hypothetical protein